MCSLIKKLISFTLLVVILSSKFVLAERSYIHIVGSTTVFPFISVAAEEFAKTYRARTPVVEATGTGGGFKLFCTGIGEKTPDIVTASRLMMDSERELCALNKVQNILEVKIGEDGIVIANAINAPKFSFTKKDLFLSLALYIPQDNFTLLKNPHNTWSQIYPTLPEYNISIYGPLKTTGTYDTLMNMVFLETCKSMNAFAYTYPSLEEREKVCSMIRDDGKFIEAGYDENIIIQKLQTNEKEFGIFGYSFLLKNSNKVQGNLINGIEPSYDNIASGKYPLARPLYIYIKLDNLNTISDLKSFVQEVISENAVGKYGYLTDVGLIPLTPPALAQMRAKVKKAL